MFSFIIYNNHHLLLYKCAHYYIYVEENDIEELLSKKS